MTSPIIRKLSLKVQKETKTGPVRNKKFLSHIQHMSSILNRSLIDKSHSQNPQPSIKQSKILTILNQSSFKVDEKRRLNSQESHYAQSQKQVLPRRQHSAVSKSQQKNSTKKTQDQSQQMNNDSTLMENVKTRSLKFQCYYKNIRQIHNKQKIQHSEESPDKSIAKKPIKQFTTNLNHQMLQSMRRHIKKGMKVIQVGDKFISDPILNYGLDIKGIEAIKPLQQSQSLPKGYKKYSAGSLLVVKKQCSKKIIQNMDSQITFINKKQSTIFTNLIGKKKSKHSKNSIDRYSQSQKQEQNTIFTRIQKMTKNLQMILHSFNCYLPQQFSGNFNMKSSTSPGKQLKNNQLETKSKKCGKYSYFVGYGNNRNLIRSLMKKRWWWVETQYINQADFVWTQLKIAHILDELKIIDDQTLKTDIKEEQNITEQTVFDTHATILQALSKSQITFSKNSIKKQDPSEISVIEIQNYKKLYKIFHKQTPNRHLSDTKIHSRTKSTDLTCLQIPQKVHNHYRLNYMFGNKNALFHNLKMYFQFLKKQDELNAIIPKTYYLEKVNKLQIKRFHQKQFASNSSQKNGRNLSNIWIVKPAQNSNRGQGISVHTTFQSIRKEICSSKNGGKFIVQSYMRNLLLYQKRKFDIRTYMLMVTINSTTKYFWYSEGYLRTSSQYYNLNDVDNVFVHLTNDAIQCDSENYGRFEPGNKLSYSQFQRYLDVNYQKEKLSVDVLNEKMKNIATKAVQAIHPKLKTEMVQYSFELFGLDFLVDKNFCPWLVEINTNPCLELSCPVLQRLIPRMLQNMFRLCLDPIFQPTQQVTKASSYFIYDNFFDINRFQLIFDQKYDSQSNWMQYCKSIEEKIYTDDNQMFENDGQQVEVEI